MAKDGGSFWIGADSASLDDLWRVYEADAEAICLATMQAVAAHPTYGPLVAGRSIPELTRDSAAKMEQALDGDWHGYEARLRQQGRSYAERGVAFGGWHEMMRSFQRQLVPRLLVEYGGDAARAARVLDALQMLVDRSWQVIGEEYLATKQRSLDAQRDLTRGSDARYRLLFDNSPAPMWVYDRETHRFLAVNRAVVESYGYSEEELLGMTIEQIRFAEDLPKLSDEEQRVKDESVPNNIGRWRHRKKDGTPIWVELQLQHTTFGGRSAHLIVASDVTERQQALASLAESEERYRSLVAATSSVVWTLSPDGRFVTPQPSWQAYTGQSYEEYAGFGWLLAMPFDDRARIVSGLRDGQASRSFYELEGRMWHAASGAYHYFVSRGVPLFDEDGSVREWIGTTTDVDERKRAEQPGRFFTLSLDLLCIIGRDGYFKRLNPAFEILGYSEEELLSQPLLDFVHPDDRAATLDMLERQERGQTIIQFENRCQCRDGSYRDLLWSSAPDPTAGVIYAIARDMTDRKRIEAERVELNRLLTLRNEELIRAGRTKSDFLAMMSHELRTPLNSIIGFSEVLIDGKFGALNEKQSRYTQNVHQSGRHLLGLINDLLDLSKVEAGRFEVVRQPCSPRTVAAEAIVTLLPLAQARNIEIALEPQPPGTTLPPVSADAARFKQVLYNLLSNAIKFTPAGGRVRVSCALSPEAGFLRITVSDTGSGITPDDIARLFTPFTQLANAKERGGTGLGLALSKQFVELMGGQIGLHSLPGEGSSFFVDLPLHELADLAPPPPAVSPRAPLVLVVEDDPAAQELIVLALQSGGYQTVAIRSGERALPEARRRRPDVITLDVFLPTVDGWEVLQLLKSDPETAPIPVVMVTISSDRAKAFSLGAIEHLVKPVGRDDLLDALTRRRFTARARTEKVTVLAIDDDATHLDLVRATLEPHGFTVRTETSGERGLDAALAEPPDLILLDLVMPDLSGVEVVSRLRAEERTRGVPILLVTGQELTARERQRLNRDVTAVIAKGAGSTGDLLQEVSRVLKKP
jgi:PAS domain S-box-containing protein